MTQILQPPVLSPTDPIRLIIEVSPGDLIRAQFTPADYALMDDVNNGAPSDTPLADQLLVMEMVMRRCEEARPKETK